MIPAQAAPPVIGNGQPIYPYIGQILAHPDIDQPTKNRAVAVGFRELEDRWQEDIRGLNAEKRSLEAQLQRAHDQKTVLEVRVTQIGADNGALRGQITDLERTIGQKNQELQGVNQSLADLEASLTARQGEVRQLNERVQKAEADAAAVAQQREREVKAANDRIGVIELQARQDVAAAAQQREIAVKAVNDRIDVIELQARQNAVLYEQRIKTVEDRALAAEAEKKRIEPNRQYQISVIRKNLVDSKNEALQTLNTKRMWSIVTGSLRDKQRAYVYSRLVIMCFDKYVGDHPGCKPDVALEKALSKAKSIKIEFSFLEPRYIFINGVLCFSLTGSYPPIT